MAEKKPSADSAATVQSEAGVAPSCALQQEAAYTQVKDALAVLFAFRIVNALCVRTFFQPDEYFQALEPAWNLVFGQDSGAWMTWVSNRTAAIGCARTDVEVG
jgi:phosphatidylinositol glycan class B